MSITFCTLKHAHIMSTHIFLSLLIIMSWLQFNMSNYYTCNVATQEIELLAWLHVYINGCNICSCVSCTSCTVQIITHSKDGSTRSECRNCSCKHGRKGWEESWRKWRGRGTVHGSNGEQIPILCHCMHKTMGQFFFPAYLSRPYQPDYMFLGSGGSCFSKLMKKKFYGHMIRP